VGRKKEIKQAVPSVAIVTGAAALELAVKRAEVDWTKAQEEASRNYDQAMHSAWGRYSSALRTYHTTNGKKAKTDGQDFDAQYDKERANALRTWNLACAVADKSLQKVLDRVGDRELTDE